MLKKVLHQNTNVYSWQPSANLTALSMQFGVLSCICDCYSVFGASTLGRIDRDKEKAIKIY